MDAELGPAAHADFRFREAARYLKSRKFDLKEALAGIRKFYEFRASNEIELILVLHPRSHSERRVPRGTRDPRRTPPLPPPHRPLRPSAAHSQTRRGPNHRALRIGQARASALLFRPDHRAPLARRLPRTRQVALRSGSIRNRPNRGPQRWQNERTLEQTGRPPPLTHPAPQLLETHRPSALQLLPGAAPSVRLHKHSAYILNTPMFFSPVF